MCVKISGFQKPPPPQSLHPDVVKEECSGEKSGCFLWDYNVNGDNLKFTTRILVRNNLSKSELRDVLDHEHQHWRDFNRRAVALKAAVEKAIKEGRDQLLDDRLEWMLYDYCQDSAAFHRKIGRLSFDTCREPSSTRPK
jgi:hypothetical protein